MSQAVVASRLGRKEAASADARPTFQEALRAVETGKMEILRVISDMETSLRMLCGGPNLGALLGFCDVVTFTRSQRQLADFVQFCEGAVVSACTQWFAEQSLRGRCWKVVGVGHNYWCFRMRMDTFRLPLEVRVFDVPAILVRPDDFPEKVPPDVEQIVALADRTPLKMDLRVVAGRAELELEDPFLVLSVEEAMVGLKRWKHGDLHGVPRFGPRRPEHGLLGRVRSLFRGRA